MIEHNVLGCSYCIDNVTFSKDICNLISELQEKRCVCVLINSNSYLGFGEGEDDYSTCLFHFN